ncbi:Mal regulon transcriptional regulator MalI [Pantoea allii]|uniref:Mal regulon transcriptional regulator MalI n=1 Tax=Pantoea allii TaxID=574096 RepID=UPI003D7A212A
MMQQKITINDVADAAGVSVTTVSMVLSGKGRISAATIERVNRTIEELGFVRNRAATTLRGGESGVIGLILQDFSHPFYAEMTAGLSESLEKKGKMLFLTQSGLQGQNLDRCFDALVEQGVDGIVFGGRIDKAEHLIARAADRQVALIFAARSSSHTMLDTVRSDNAQAARLATEYLIQHGHQRIAWLGGSSASLTRAERIGSYCATLMQYGLPFKPEWIVECGSTPKEASEATVKLLHQHPHITAVMAYNASTTLGCYFGLLKSGRSVKGGTVESYYEQQIALLGFGDDPLAELADPPITQVIDSAREMGRAAAERILLRIAHPESERHVQIIAPQLIARGSA